MLPASTDYPAFQLRNLDALLKDYPAAVGIKPGCTGDADACLVGMAVRGLLAVLMNAQYRERLEARLLDWGFKWKRYRCSCSRRPSLRDRRRAEHSFTPVERLTLRRR